MKSAFLSQLLLHVKWLFKNCPQGTSPMALWSPSLSILSVPRLLMPWFYFLSCSDNFHGPSAPLGGGHSMVLGGRDYLGQDPGQRQL